MERIIEASIELHVPTAVAYAQWIHFEQFPEFMSGVKEVRQLDEAHLHWRAEVAGMQEEWDAEIIEQVPGRRIAWRNTNGARNTGVVTFLPLNERESRLLVRLRYEPRGLTETVGDSLGLVRRRVVGDLKRFKEFTEERAAGQWMARIPSKDVLVGQ